MKHQLTVGELRAVLAAFDSKDIAEVNAVGNLSIIRDEEWIAWCDLVQAAQMGVEERIHWRSLERIAHE